MTAPQVLFAHERRAVGRAVSHVLEREGFSVHIVTGGKACREAIHSRAWDALVVDVALPEVPGYELCEEARAVKGDAGARVIVLVASVYRRTSYKRRPTRLYGADDYVEIHHLCDDLPAKLRQHLALPDVAAAETAQAEAREQLRVEGDARMQPADQERLASLIVADMILYNGDALHAATDLRSAERAVAADLQIARDMFAQILRSEPAGRGGAVSGSVPTPRADPMADPMADPIGDAFARLLGALGRGEGR